MKKTVIYVVQKKNFFSSSFSVGGHLSHFEGIYGALKGRFKTVVTSIDTNDSPRGAQENWKIFNPKNWFQEKLGYFFYCLYLKKIVEIESPHFIYSRGAFLFMPFIPLLKYFVKCPIVLELNNIGYNKFKLFGIVDFIGLTFSDIIACNSKGTKSSILKISKKFEKKILIIPNGIGKQFLSETISLNQEEGVFDIGFFGTFKNGKYGIDALIKGFKLIDDQSFRLHLYGDGPHLNALKTIASNHPRIYFHGTIEHKLVPQALQTMHLLVNTSYFETQSSIKIYEYMSSGIPMLIANNPQDAITIKNGKFGYLFEGDDENDIEDKIKFIASNYEQALMVAKSARVEVALNHTWEKRLSMITDKINDNSL